MSRPGAQQLQSVVAEERRGRPSAAIRAATGAARADPSQATDHRLDEIYALLIAGEPKAARQALAELEPALEDPVRQRRARACHVWADQLDRNWYPGDTGAELLDDAGPPTLADEVAPGDPETMLLDGCVAQGPIPLLSVRSLLPVLARQRSRALHAVLMSGMERLGEFNETAQACGVPLAALWASLARADLAWRGGFPDQGEAMLATVREAYQSIGDGGGLALTHLVEGDWYAAPASSPEALGFELAQQTGPSPQLELRDHGRAADCYAFADLALTGVDAPRAAGALALRRAHLAWAAGRYGDQISSLDAAEHAYSAAGDAAPLRLIAVHRLIGGVTFGDLVATREQAGTGWDLEPRGPIREVVEWATRRGSASFVAGLGRLLQRAGEGLVHDDAHDAATVALATAIPLLRFAGGVVTGTVLDALAGLDSDRNFTARGLARLELTLREVPPLTRIGDNPLPWMQRVGLVTSVVKAQSERVGTSHSSLTGLGRALGRLRALLTVDDLPAENPSLGHLRGAPAALERLATARRDDEVADIGPGMFAEQQREMLAMTAQSVREQVANVSALLAVQRGRSAQAEGWSEKADGWFGSALRLVDAGPPDHRWIGVLACAAWGREAEALARMQEIQVDDVLPDHLRATLALRARDYARASEGFAVLDAGQDLAALPWADVLSRAEARLGVGDAEGAYRRATAAINDFEDIVGTLGRDPDRLAMCDDIKATSLYLTAARASLAMAEERGVDGASARRALEHSFELSDRGRSLALSTMLSGVQSATPEDDSMRRRWQEAATVWSASFERLLAAFERNAEPNTAAVPEEARELTRADRELIIVEAEVEAARPGTLAAARRLPASPTLQEIQRWLTPGCCLLQYHVVSSDLVSWAVTGDDVTAHYQRLPAGGLEALARSFWAGCAYGGATETGEELAAFLLGPAADALGASARVIVVPFGPLNLVPFHALPFDGESLGQSHVLSLLPAAAMLAGRELDQPLDGLDAVVVGDPAFDPAAQPQPLSRLPGAAVEARAVGRHWPGADVLIDTDATEPTLRELLPGRGIVHLAAHGQLDDVAPSDSALVLAGADRLTVADLIGLRLDAQLAVLSACDSGRGATTLGGDVVGLTRGLLAAGVRQAVVSLWPVDDLSACVTMAVFHERLAAHRVPAHALAEAQALVRSLSAEDLRDRYRQLDGVLDVTGESRRRGSATPPSPHWHLAPEPDGLAGASESAWAPFVLVGA